MFPLSPVGGISLQSGNLRRLTQGNIYSGFQISKCALRSRDCDSILKLYTRLYSKLSNVFLDIEILSIYNLLNALLIIIDSVQIMANSDTNQMFALIQV